MFQILKSITLNYIHLNYDKFIAMIFNWKEMKHITVPLADPNTNDGEL